MRLSTSLLLKAVSSFLTVIHQRARYSLSKCVKIIQDVMIAEGGNSRPPFRTILSKICKFGVFKVTRDSCFIRIFVKRRSRVCWLMPLFVVAASLAKLAFRKRRWLACTQSKLCSTLDRSFYARGRQFILTKEPFYFIFQPIWPVRSHKALLPFCFSYNIIWAWAKLYSTSF